MPANDPNLGLTYDWGVGENVKTGMDANLRQIGALLHLSVLSRTVDDPPGSPSNGDRYIIPAGATGDWSGRTNQVAVRVGGAWEYYTPATGWQAHVQDDGDMVRFDSGEGEWEIVGADLSAAGLLLPASDTSTGLVNDGDLNDYTDTMFNLIVSGSVANVAFGGTRQAVSVYRDGAAGRVTQLALSASAGFRRLALRFFDGSSWTDWQD